MLNKLYEKNSDSLYYTPEEKSTKLGFFSAARVVLPLKKNTGNDVNWALILIRTFTLDGDVCLHGDILLFVWFLALFGFVCVFAEKNIWNMKDVFF